MTNVYGNFDQETLDTEYLISQTVPAIEPFLEDYMAGEEARAYRVRAKTLPTATHRRRSSAFFQLAKMRRSSFSFTADTGGCSARESSLAPTMVPRGIAVISVNYTLVSEGTSITEIVRRCRAAITWTAKMPAISVPSTIDRILSAARPRRSPDRDDGCGRFWRRFRNSRGYN